MGDWKHVESLDGGMVTNVPPTRLKENQSPRINGMIVRDGVVESDEGYLDYPAPGVLKTNALDGTFMMAKQLYLASGVTYLVVASTTCLYKYNTTTETFDVISQGTLVENCEDAWVASANVTATADTAVKLRGSKSSKMVVAAAFTTGVIAYENFGAIDLSAAANSHVSFWIYTGTAVANDVLRLRLSEENAGGTGATYADFTVPAIGATAWTHVVISMDDVVAGGGTYPTDLNAVLSVSLVAQSDPGAVTVYLDDIRTILGFTGDEDNRFSMAQMNDTMGITNGVDQPQKWTGTGLAADLVTTLVAGAITTSEIIIEAKDHFVLFNNTENGADAPNRASWTNIGTIEDHTNGTAGYQDIGDESWVIAVEQMSESEWIIYKEREVSKMTWVAGQTPFRFEPMVDSRGAAGKDCVVNLGGKHVVLDDLSIYGYVGDREVKDIDGDNKRNFFNELNTEYKNRSFGYYDDRNNEILLYVPVVDSIPDTVWTLDTLKAIWWKRKRNVSGFGRYESQSNITIGELVGTIGDQNYRIGDNSSKLSNPIFLLGDDTGQVFEISSSTYNNDGVAVTNIYETPDFTVSMLDAATLTSSTEDISHFVRVMKLIYEAKGDLVTTEYSTDGGTSWFPTQANASNVQTLTNVFELYEQDFDMVDRKIRFRWINSTLSSGFKLRYYGAYWTKRSTRR